MAVTKNDRFMLQLLQWNEIPFLAEFMLHKLVT